MIDGEAVILCLDGNPAFNALHSGKHHGEVQFCAFDVLALDGDDLRRLPLSTRKTNLERLLRGRTVFLLIHLRWVRSAQVSFKRHALGLEGLVSECSDSKYRGRTVPKVKSRTDASFNW